MSAWQDAAHRQGSYGIRFDWGTRGATAVAAGADVAVVVDVLSFTTTLTVALDGGTLVLPYRWNDETAVAYAREHDAVLAVGRSAAEPGGISLSAASVRAAEPAARLVLPSPNGSTIAHQLGSGGAECLGASLRNAAAVAAWIGSHHVTGTASVAVIAAGERWPDGGLRPALEDLWGAGAVIAGLAAAGWTSLSPEAELARVGHAAVRGRELAALLSCASGRELTDNGYRADVEIAAEVDRSDVVPILLDQRFVDGS
ncbi:MAG: 2-phosphosulfolactate phosphatase [Pseudonocardiales bacterium]|nr:MAG: 2-phosphosulfolactate phosphatase [Pseudonocardiales bacterium]